MFWQAIFFLTAGHYRFSPERNLMLAAAMGAIYAVAAAGAGRPGAALLVVVVAARGADGGAGGLDGRGDRCRSPRAHSEAVLWAAALLGAAASAVTWPIVESYLSAGRHGAEMRAAIGWFNVTWTPATALALSADADRQPGRARWRRWCCRRPAASPRWPRRFALPTHPGAHERGGRAGGGRPRVRLPRARGVVAAADELRPVRGDVAAAAASAGGGQRR